MKSVCVVALVLLGWVGFLAILPKQPGVNDAVTSMEIEVTGVVQHYTFMKFNAAGQVIERVDYPSAKKRDK